MIPIPDNFVPRSIRENWKLRAVVVLFSLVAVSAILIYDYKQSVRELMEGPRLKELDKRIALDLFDSVAVALEKYRENRGQYPQVDGKYFFDSVKSYVNISNVLVYADTFDSHGVARVIEALPGKRFDYRDISHTYLGVGRCENVIVYKPCPPNSYLLYWIGENVIDEGGSGDDVVFRQ
jgi:hypothetical protein